MNGKVTDIHTDLLFAEYEEVQRELDEVEAIQEEMDVDFDTASDILELRRKEREEDMEIDRYERETE